MFIDNVTSGLPSIPDLAGAIRGSDPTNPSDAVNLQKLAAIYQTVVQFDSQMISLYKDISIKIINSISAN